MGHAFMSAAALYMQEHQDSVPDEAASRHFFQDLASQNEATSSTFEGELSAGKCGCECRVRL